ncbi:MAG: hypothetical protein AB1492_07920 [Bacillota bacterium]
MHTYTLECDTQAQARETREVLSNKLKVTGEILLRQAGGKWVLEVSSERQLREGSLEKLPGRLVPA